MHLLLYYSFLYVQEEERFAELSTLLTNILMCPQSFQIDPPLLCHGWNEILILNYRFELLSDAEN